MSYQAKPWSSEAEAMTHARGEGMGQDYQERILATVRALEAATGRDSCARSCSQLPFEAMNEKLVNSGFWKVQDLRAAEEKVVQAVQKALAAESVQLQPQPSPVLHDEPKPSTPPSDWLAEHDRELVTRAVKRGVESALCGTGKDPHPDWILRLVEEVLNGK